MKSAVVTGGTGFIGKWLVSGLLDAGAEVTLVLLPEITDMEALPKSPKLNIVPCGMDSFEKLPELISERGFDVFFHMAWWGSAGPLRGDVTEQLKNVQYSCDAVRAAAALKCRRFVGAGSIMEDEANVYLSQADAEPSINYIYSCAKLTAHQMCRVVAAHAGIPFCWGKISNAYGEGDLTGRFMHATVEKMRRGEPCSFTEGNQLYDFIYVSEVAQAFIAIGEKGIPGNAYYIGTKNVKPLKEYILDIRQATGSVSKLDFGAVPFKGALLPKETFDAGPLARDTGFHAKTGLDEGIKKYMEWLGERQE